MVCSICLSKVIKPKKLPCGHEFCKDCINNWLSISPAHDCPHCRTIIEIPIKPSVPRLITVPAVVRRVNRYVYYYFHENNPFCVMLIMVLQGLRIILVLSWFYLIGWLMAPNPVGTKNSNINIAIGNGCIYILLGMFSSITCACYFQICHTNQAVDQS